MQAPTFTDVLAAQKNIAPHLPRTPLFNYPALDRATGMELYVKHENYHPIGAFKVRGGINLISQLPADECRRGVIAASTGNHGQSIAYAARLFGVPATIVVPEAANEVKVQAMDALGATIVHHGADFAAAVQKHCAWPALRQRWPWCPPAARAAAMICTLRAPSRLARRLRARWG